MKKKYHVMMVRWIISAVSVLFLTLIIYAITLEETPGVQNETAGKGKATIVKLNHEVDFPNKEEGTFVMDLDFDIAGIVKDLKVVPRYLVFLESKKIPGLAIRYNPLTSSLEGGLPLMRAEDVFIFDDQKHQVAYMFKKGGRQALFFDGQEVASSIFGTGLNLVTGNFVLEQDEFDTVDIYTGAKSFDKVLTPEEIDNLQ